MSLSLTFGASHLVCAGEPSVLIHGILFFTLECPLPAHFLPRPSDNSLHPGFPTLVAPPGPVTVPRAFQTAEHLRAAWSTVSRMDFILPVLVTLNLHVSSLGYKFLRLFLCTSCPQTSSEKNCSNEFHVPQIWYLLCYLSSQKWAPQPLKLSQS